MNWEYLFFYCEKSDIELDIIIQEYQVDKFNEDYYFIGKKSRVRKKI